MLTVHDGQVTVQREGTRSASRYSGKVNEERACELVRSLRSAFGVEDQIRYVDRLSIIIK